MKKILCLISLCAVCSCLPTSRRSHDIISKKIHEVIGGYDLATVKINDTLYCDVVEVNVRHSGGFLINNSHFTNSYETRKARANGVPMFSSSSDSFFIETPFVYVDFEFIEYYCNKLEYYINQRLSKTKAHNYEVKVLLPDSTTFKMLEKFAINDNLVFWNSFSDSSKYVYKKLMEKYIVCDGNAAIKAICIYYYRYINDYRKTTIDRFSRGDLETFIKESPIHPKMRSDEEIYAAYKQNKLLDLHGNVSEMLSHKGIAMGGSFLDTMPKKEFYKKPHGWIGFRCIYIIRKKGNH